MPKTFYRPTIVISECLLSAPCRWDCTRIRDDFVRRLRRRVRFQPVCPEMEIDLGAPRDPIRLVQVGDSVGLFQPSTKRRLTGRMTRFAREMTARLKDVDGIILKHKSPSCGIRGAKLFDSASQSARVIARRSGIFAAEILSRFDDYPAEDEERLEKRQVREQFLTRIFTLANYRATERLGRLSGLVKFHSRNESLLRTYSVGMAQRMSGLIEEEVSSRAVEIPDQYGYLLRQALMRRPRKDSIARTFSQALDHFRNDLNWADIGRFEKSLEEYVNGDVSPDVLREIVRIWAVRYDRAWVRQQAFFNPFPEHLL
ncbi:MAG: DUF1722 domain-containing protein [Candidatus Zixiibacteriota bacterium]|nr:MAG: DUF1722 domain-containing protein [candidate division Zixibacteria bacterium]